MDHDHLLTCRQQTRVLCASRMPCLSSCHVPSTRAACARRDGMHIFLPSTVYGIRYTEYRLHLKTNCLRTVKDLAATKGLRPDRTQASAVPCRAVPCRTLAFLQTYAMHSFVVQLLLDQSQLCICVRHNPVVKALLFLEVRLAIGCVFGAQSLPRRVVMSA